MAQQTPLQLRPAIEVRASSSIAISRSVRKLFDHPSYEKKIQANAIVAELKKIFFCTEN
jgi:hypothetical protein